MANSSPAFPWPPGQRDLTFSYVLANTKLHCLWQRPLDLPSTQVRVVVSGGQADRATSNLDRAAHNENGEIAFESGQHEFSAGYPLRVQLEHMPVTIMNYAPWAATTTLLGLLAATCLPVICRRRRV